MAQENLGVDSLGIFLTGGPANEDPAASLGGRASSRRVQCLGAAFDRLAPATRVDHVYTRGARGLGGVGRLASDSAGNYAYTPPGGRPGESTAVAEGATVVVPGDDPSEAVLVARESGLVVRGSGTVALVDLSEGPFSHGDVSNARRAAGVTTYRALMLRPRGQYDVLGVRVYLGYVGTPLQSRFGVGVESPRGTGDELQVIADETVAPVGVSFVETSPDAPLVVGTIGAGSFLGLWVRRKFPAGGSATPFEEVRFVVRFDGSLR